MTNEPDNNPSASDRALMTSELLRVMTGKGMGQQEAFDVLAGREFGNAGTPPREAIINAIVGLGGVVESAESSPLNQYVNDYAAAWNMKPEDAEAKLRTNNPDLFENPPWT